MNYLAHVFLSGDDEELLFGNFIADAVKGKQGATYAPGIAKGIRLHRLIDTYTDTHPIVAESKARLRPKYRKYAPVVADMFFDHFLASQFEQYAQEPLERYTQRVYNIINSNSHLLPQRVQHFFPHMMQHNWLLSYARVEGVGQALTGMSRRAAFASGMETAAEELVENYTLYAADFALFFPELVAYVKQLRSAL
ncbi:ACP phosphodiesterase [Pontibacter harenae]|uniref:acyl carrier protein phosphodiesterase n=1 Tax=Pontibacter harenae TaxID=2894083 RepID=UPI001E2D7EB3|nr:ACP phosphodiesterase [Pontibacter harenae]MCC9167028.1 ACP phosphodiesterase [Pontibacter harenae]